jgi:acyl-coenzyme A thioesterase PaaI-like protein
MSFSPTPPTAAPLRNTVPFHDHAQIEILDAPRGQGRARIPDIAELRNHLGTVHGGMLFAVGEVTAAAAMMRLLGADMTRVRAITRKATVEYLKPARGAISGTGEVGMTRDEIFLALELQPSLNVPISVALSDAAGVVVAKLQVDWFVGRPKP